MDFSRKNYDEIVSSVSATLKENSEWLSRYSKYGTAIIKNTETIQTIKKNFRQWAPLYLYMNITEAKSSMKFQLRYRGQRVAEIFRRGEKILISTSGLDEKNKRDFGCTITLSNVEWTSSEATGFRKHFRSNPVRSGKSPKNNEEHRVESMLLSEFEKKASSGKSVISIQPVKVAQIARFQMPTPFRGSDAKNIKYANSNGGGIDILCRIGKGKGTRLCVIEVKDENVASEPPTAAIKQALIYGTFIIELLRSKSGQVWWEIFGFSGKLPKAITLAIACAMPYSKTADASFEGHIVNLGNDRIELHSLFFDEHDNMISKIRTSIPQCIASSEKG